MVGNTVRVTSPSRSSARSVSVSIRCEMLPSARRSSLNRFGPSPSAETTSTVHLSPTRARTSLTARQSSATCRSPGIIRVPSCRRALVIYLASVSNQYRGRASHDKAQDRRHRRQQSPRLAQCPPGTGTGRARGRQAFLQLRAHRRPAALQSGPRSRTAGERRPVQVRARVGRWRAGGHARAQSFHSGGAQERHRLGRASLRPELVGRQGGGDRRHVAGRDRRRDGATALAPDSRQLSRRPRHGRRSLYCVQARSGGRHRQGIRREHAEFPQRLRRPVCLSAGPAVRHAGAAERSGGVTRHEEHPMSIRPVKRIVQSRATMEGAGVKLRRAFGFGETSEFDPFLLFDDFRNERPDDYRAGFPWHPHRGIETITYVLAGTIVRVVVGDFWGKRGPVDGIAADPRYLDIFVPPGKRKTLPVETERHAFAYVFEGSGTFRDASKPFGVLTEKDDGDGGEALVRERTGNRSLVLFDRGDEVTVQAGEEGIRFLLVSGKPIEEPVAWYGPIVMNT